MIAQIFIPTTELKIPTGTQTNGASAEIETQPVTLETTISNYSALFKYMHAFIYFSCIKSLCFISFMRQLLVSSIFLKSKLET